MIALLVILLIGGVAAAGGQELASDAASTDIESDSDRYAACASHSGSFGGDIWELSTRHIGCVNGSTSGWLDRIQVSKWSGSDWKSSSITEALYQSTESVVPPRTIVYVHGNWMERDNARERARFIDSHIARRAIEPYRLVMLSWPSEKNAPVIQDIRGNARLADANATIGLELLQALDESPTQVSILGFSLGARTVTGALNLKAMSPNAQKRYRVSLMAPAVDRDWLQPYGKEPFALSTVDSMVNLYNSNDPVLKRFRFIDRDARPIAAGFLGFERLSYTRSTNPLTTNPLIRQYDCGRTIGTTHQERSYYSECSCTIIAIDNLLGK